MSDKNVGEPSLVVEPFEYIEGNIKGLTQVRLTKRLVAFVGENRTGKTAALDTFRLALTGEHPVGPHGSQLMELAPPDAPALYAQAFGPNGQKTSFRVETEAGKAKKPPEKPDRDGVLKAVEMMPDADKVFENMLPISSMRALVRLGSSLGREAIFRRFGAITTLPVPRGLADVHLALWKEGVAAVTKPDVDTAETLSAASAWFRKKKLELGREIKALKQLLEEREAALTPLSAGAEELPKLRADLDRARAWEASAALRARKTELEAEVARYIAAVTPLRQAAEGHEARDAENHKTDQAKRDAITELKAGVEAARAEVADALKRAASELAELLAECETVYQKELTDLDAEIKQQTFYLAGGEWLLECNNRAAKSAVDGVAACLVCSNPYDPAALEAQARPRYEARKAAVEKLFAKRDAVSKSAAKKKANFEKLAAETRVKIEQAGVDALNAAQRAVDAAELSYAEWKATIENTRRGEEMDKSKYRAEHARLKAATEENDRALASVPEAYSGPTTVELDGRIRALESADTASKQLDAEVRKVRELELVQGYAKTLEQETSRELNELLARTAESANAAVNKYMPDDFRAQLDLETAKWNVFGRDGRPHRVKVMSGAECGSLIPALACAWTEGAPGRFVILDDEDLAPLSPKNLRLLLASLKDAVDANLLTQVFIAWNRPEEIPDDWGQKIYTDGSGAAVAPAFAPPPPSNGGNGNGHDGEQPTLLL